MAKYRVKYEIRNQYQLDIALENPGNVADEVEEAHFSQDDHDLQGFSIHVLQVEELDVQDPS